MTAVAAAKEETELLSSMLRDQVLRAEQAEAQLQRAQATLDRQGVELRNANTTLAALSHTTLTVSHEWISDFQGAPEEDIKPLGMPHVHDAVQPHPITGEACLYLPLNPEGLKDARTGEHWAKNPDVWDRLEAAGYSYDHEWREGDLLLWDNLQVLHRAGGGSGDRPRLLLRTQTVYSEGAA